MSGRMLLLADKSDDDDDFGDPSGAERRGLEDSRARLATLFNSGVSQLGGKSVEEALSYSAPKEPSSTKANDAPTEENASAKPVFSSAVYAFVLDGEQYQPQGKVGLALIHAKGGKSKVILYLASKKLICQSLITEDYVVTIKDLYATFADQHGRPWSVAFDDRSALCQFARVLVATIGALKANHSYSVDLQVGEGDAVAAADLVELASLHYSVDEGIHLAEYRSEEGLRVKVGRVKGSEPWENALIGMRRHGQRVIVAQTATSQQLLGGEQAMEVVVATLKRVKFADASKNDAARLARAGTPTSVERAPQDASSNAVDIPSSEPEIAAEALTPSSKPADASCPGIEDEAAKKPSDIRSRMARIGRPLVALAAHPGGGNDVPIAVDQQSSSSAAHSAPSSPSSTKSVESAVVAKSVAEPHPIVSEPHQTTSEPHQTVITAAINDSVNKLSSIPTASDQINHSHPLPFFFPYGTNSTAQGFPASIPHYPFVHVPMHSAQPSLGDLEERIVAKVSNLHVELQESIAALVSKTVSDAVLAQASSTSAAVEKGKAMPNGSDAVLTSISDRIERLEKKIDELQASCATRQPQSPPDDTDRRVKRIMSRLYKSAVEAFPSTEEGYCSETIHTSLLALIKEATMSALEPPGANVAANDNDIVYAIVENCVDTVAN